MNFKQVSRKAAQFLNPKTLWEKVKNAYYQYKRVLIRTKKPNRQEFLDVVKISAAGMLAIGLLGFVIQTIFIHVIKI